MLSQSDKPIGEIIRQFAEFGVEAAFLVPTETGLKKSILDAHEALRRFLRNKGIHDFDTQLQGPDHKVVMNVDVVQVDRFDIRKLSLYRPEAKNGDPRLWIAKLEEIARSGNLIALFVTSTGRLAAVNCSDEAIWSTRKVSGSPLNRALTNMAHSAESHELLEHLRTICKQGFIPSRRSGDTGVGYTLESLLGIPANVRKTPDFKGIELKASRVGTAGEHKNRTTLFSKTPDWQASALQSGGELLDRYGYLDQKSGRLQIYCTVSDKPNTQGLYLGVSESPANVEMKGSSEAADVVWSLSELESTLAAKHKETFWVSAQRRKSSAGTEEFHYVTVTHTRGPLLANLGPLIASGVVQVDLTLSRKEDGGTRDHGYLFRFSQRDLGLLFSVAAVYDLAA